MTHLWPTLDKQEAASRRQLHTPAHLAKTLAARALESKGYEAWLRTLGPRTFTKPFSGFHRELWTWYWDVRLKLLRGEILAPDELAFLAIWFRGGGKSSNVEWCCIAEGGLVGNGFVMYVCDTEKQAKKHVLSIRDRLDSPEIAHYYPGLANPKVDKHGQQVGWRQDYLATASGWGIVPVGLDQGIRGGRQRDMRFTMIVLDDIDSHEDTPAAIEKKLDLISRSILPAGTSDTLVLFPQNLIHENSVLNQIYTRRSDVLSERIVSGPVSAFAELDLELDDSAEGRKWTIRSCTPTWTGLDVGDARKFLGKFGRRAFLSEYQHEFNQDREELVLQHYDDAVHVIRRSDFERVFKTRGIPAEWNKYAFHDWARTKSAYHANIAGKVTVSSQNSALPGRIFLFDLMSFEANTQADDVALRFLKSLTSGMSVSSARVAWDELVQASLSRANLERFMADATRLIEARREVLTRVIPAYVAPLLREQNFRKFRMSHEAKTQRQVYRTVYGLPFEASNPGEDGGVEWLNHYMQINREAEHPFTPGITGAAGLYIIVEDERFAFPQSMTPDSLHDSDLARFQFKHWRYRAPKLTEAGLIERGVQKLNDDFPNGLMMLFHDNCVKAAPLTIEERREEMLPASLQSATIAGLPPEEQGQAWMTQQIRLTSMKAEEARGQSVRTSRFVNKYSFKGRGGGR
ncbi:MAG: hypothetical protein ACR2LC_14895 [Pyrinomonadaceae bacterium]